LSRVRDQYFLNAGKKFDSGEDVTRAD